MGNTGRPRDTMLRTVTTPALCDLVERVERDAFDRALLAAQLRREVRDRKLARSEAAAAADAVS